MSSRSFTIKRVRKFFLGIFVFITFLLLWVSQTVRSINMSYQIQALQQEIKIEENKMVELIIKKNKLISLKKVEEVARDKMGFTIANTKNIILMKSPRD